MHTNECVAFCRLQTTHHAQQRQGALCRPGSLAHHDLRAASQPSAALSADSFHTTLYPQSPGRWSTCDTLHAPKCNAPVGLTATSGTYLPKLAQREMTPTVPPSPAGL
jgi:hypothetical protein